MRGHEKLIEYRRMGKSPRDVFVNDYPCNTDWYENPGDHATISTDGDDVELLDLRFLVGLTVHISSPSEIRAKALFEACKRAKALRVGASVTQGEKRAWDQSGWAAVWHHDAKGVA